MALLRSGSQICSLAIISSLTLAHCGAAPKTPSPPQSSYNPLDVPEGTAIRELDLQVDNPPRQRIIPLRIYLPNKADPQPVVLFSHGLGGTRNGCTYLGRHWARRGYVAVFVQHPGSDDSVWRDIPRQDRLEAMDKAANGKNFRLRVQDVPTVLDQLEKWNQTQNHVLNDRLDLQHIGMSGHSFGAVTTQAVSGQGFLRGQPIFTDERIKAAVVFSPSSPRRGSASTAFSTVRVPWMLVTGTHDTAMIGGADVESRLQVFPNLPPGSKFELVLHEAEHSAFTDRSLPGDRKRRNPNHHRAILALSTAFWDTYLRNDEDAEKWLNSPGPDSLLEEKDRWQTK